MKKYIMILKNKEKIALTSNQRDAVVSSIENGSPFVTIGDELIPLQIVPTIITVERWYAQENQRLASFNKRLCKFCLSSMDVMAGCACWGKNGGEKQDAIEGTKLPSWLLEKFGDFPKLDEPSYNNLKEQEDFLI